MNKVLGFSLVLALAGLTAPAHAADGHSFLRAEGGKSDVELDAGELGDGSDKDTAWSVRGGYFFNPNVGVEVFYSRFYDESQDGVFGELTGFGVGVVGKRNFGADGNGFFIDGRAGLARLDAEVGIVDFGKVGDHSAQLYFGVGAGYDFSESFGLSLNYDRYQAGFDYGIDVDADVLTLGGEVRF